MADTQKTTAILDFQIEQGDALRELEATKKSILQLKQEQKELNDAYKSGLISVDKYAAEQVKLEATLKKQTAQYNNVQKSVTGIKSSFDKLNESIKDQAKQVTVAGVSLSSFINPVTGTIAVLGLLGKAYASSAVGAKDLQFATNQASAALDIYNDAFARLISSEKDGEGFLSKTGNFFLGLLNTFGSPQGNIAQRSKEVALNIEKMEQLTRDLSSVQADNNERLAENQELLTKIQDSQTSYAEKVHLTGEMIANLRKNEEEVLKVKNQELAILESQVGTQVDQEKLEGLINEKKKEISRVTTDTERKVNGILRLESNIKDQLEAQAAALQKQTDQRQLQADIEREKKAQQSIEFVRDVIGESIKPEKIDLEAGATESLAKATAHLSQETAKLNPVRKVSNELTDDQRVKLLALSTAMGVVQNAFEGNTEAYKPIAITKALIDTYLGADAMFAQLPFPVNFVAAAAVIASGLANVGKISAAAGGGSFVTKGPALLMVGDNPGGVERVDVTPVSGTGRTRAVGNLVQMGAGGTMIADGGVVKDSISRRASMMSFPKIEVVASWRDFSDFSDKKATQLKWTEV